MRKRIRGRKFNRKADQRKALLRTLATSLILKEKIKTTEAKAKELSFYVGKKISQARKNTVPTRRNLAKFFSPKTVQKLVNDLGVRYQARKGGYTRIIKLGKRMSDAAKMVIIELVK